MILSITAALALAASASADRQQVTSSYVRPPFSPQIPLFPSVFGAEVYAHDVSGAAAAPTQSPTQERIPAQRDVEQRTITHVAEGSVLLSWVSAQGTTVHPKPVNYSTIFYGTSPYDLNMVAYEASAPDSYKCKEPQCGARIKPPRADYESGLMHHTTLHGLVPDTTYFWSCDTPQAHRLLVD